MIPLSRYVEERKYIMYEMTMAALSFWLLILLTDAML